MVTAIEISGIKKCVVREHFDPCCIFIYSIKGKKNISLYGSRPLYVDVTASGLVDLLSWLNSSLTVESIHWDFICLVMTGTMVFYDFPYIGNVIIPTDFRIFFKRGRLKPPSNSSCWL